MDRPRPVPALGPNHRRGIEAALCHLDRTLCRFEQIADGTEQESVFYRERNRLSGDARAELAAEIAFIRRILNQLKGDLDLGGGSVEDLARHIWADTGGMWEMLVETESKCLRRYGALPAGLAEYLDPVIETLIERVGRISRIAWRSLQAGGEHTAAPPASGDQETPHEKRPPSIPPETASET